MSRRTQLTTKFIFQITAQLSENFIFIYLGMTLFTETNLVYKPLFILVTIVGICAARWLSVFPLSKAINYIIRLRARRRGVDVPDELPYNYQCMLFWAGLRGAVGVALAAGLSGENGAALRATVLVVVVLTVIIFGGTTASMLQILGIRTGVVEEIDSDDEFDIETTNAGTYYKRGGQAFGHTPKGSASIGLDYVDASQAPMNGSAKHGRPSRQRNADRGYSSSNRHSPSSRERARMARKNSQNAQRDREEIEQTDNLLLSHSSTSNTISDNEDSDADPGAELDLPPAAPSQRKPSPRYQPSSKSNVAGSTPEIMVNDEDITAQSSPSTTNLLHTSHPITHTAQTAGIGGSVSGIRDLIRGATRGDIDSTAWLKSLDENYIKPTLLLDQGQGRDRSPGGSNV